MDTMLTYNTNSKTGPVCGGRAHPLPAFVGLFYLSANHIKFTYLIKVNKVLGEIYEMPKM